MKLQGLVTPARVATSLLATGAVLALGCGSDGSSSSSSSGGSANAGASTTAVSADPKCGLGNGKKATGTPIKIGALVTKIAGIDFTDGTSAAGAYFTCLNDNGGINGHPVQFIPQDHGVDPQQVRSLATKLIESDKVDAMVASFSTLDCTVNGDYYEKNGINALVAGVVNECFKSPSIAPLNMGPGYSMLGAANYLISKGAKSIVVDSPKQPGYTAINDIGLSEAKAKGLKAVNVLDNVPIQDPASVAQSLVSQAGDGGGVVLDFTPPEGVKILQAAAQQGLIDKVMWASSTPLNDVSVPKALGDQWDGKIAINAELTTLDSNGADMQLYRSINAKYSPDRPLGSFGQMGFVAAKMVSDTMLKLPEDQLNRAGINKAIEGIQDYKTDILCKPWYFQDMKLHIPNNVDRTVTTKAGKIVQLQGCTAIPASYPDLQYVRKFESQNDVNKG